MAKKVTVSIPDLLHEKMEKWRTSFNLSKMFQDAVTEAIHKKEEFQKRIREDLDLNQIVERLRNEKMQSEGNYLDSGHRDGVHWAKTAHYDDLIYAVAWDSFETVLDDGILGDYFREKQKNMGLDRPTVSEETSYFLVYVRGWKSGVEQFWNEVSDKL